MNQLCGVGYITALTFVLTLGTKQRFPRSRDVCVISGLRPRRSQSGDRDPQLGITKAGNVYLRSLLIECVSHIRFNEAVPSPAVFNHAITAISQGSGDAQQSIWLDFDTLGG